MIRPIRKPALWPYLKSSSYWYPQTFCFSSGLEISFDFRVLWIRDVILSWNFSSRTTILLWSTSNKKRNLSAFYVWNGNGTLRKLTNTLNDTIRLFLYHYWNTPSVRFRFHLTRTVNRCYEMLIEKYNLQMINIRLWLSYSKHLGIAGWASTSYSSSTIFHCYRLGIPNYPFFPALYAVTRCHIRRVIVFY